MRGQCHPHDGQPRGPWAAQTCLLYSAELVKFTYSYLCSIQVSLSGFCILDALWGDLVPGSRLLRPGGQVRAAVRCWDGVPSVRRSLTSSWPERCGGGLPVLLTERVGFAGVITSGC